MTREERLSTPSVLSLRASVAKSDSIADRIETSPRRGSRRAISLSVKDGDCFVAEFTPLSAGLLAVTGNLQRKQPKTIFLPPL